MANRGPGCSDWDSLCPGVQASGELVERTLRTGDARNYHIAVWRLQESQLHGNEKQEEAPGPAGAEEVLPGLSAPHGAYRSKVEQLKVDSQRSKARHSNCGLLIVNSRLFLQGRQING